MTPILQLESVNFLQKLNIFSQKKDAQVNWEGLTALVPNVASPANRICKLLGRNSTSSHKKRRSSEAWRLYFVRIRVFQIRFDVEMEVMTNPLFNLVKIDQISSITSYYTGVYKKSKIKKNPAKIIKK